MRRRKERGNDGREVVREKNRGSAPDEITRGRGKFPGNEQELQEENEPREIPKDLKNDRRERRRERHE
jgi:hypothetical protein